MSYKVKLREFEGPFDLLVYLIENAEMSIYDIRISEITGAYLEYLSTMKEMNINVSSEFLVLAAELLNIKSKMMLPQPEQVGMNVVTEDPRSALVERLLAYKLCKQQSLMLKEQQEQMEGVYEKPQEDISVYLDHPDEYLSLGLSDFAKAFNQFLTRKQRIDETRRRYTRIERERITVESRMNFIRDTFIRALESGDITERDFRDLIPPLTVTRPARKMESWSAEDEKKARKGAARYSTIVSFTSLLQMMRDRFLDADQNETYGRITVRPGEIDIREYNAEEASQNLADEEKDAGGVTDA